MCFECLRVLFFQNVKFEPIVKSDASHDPKGKSTGKEVIVRVTNIVSRKVCTRKTEFSKP